MEELRGALRSGVLAGVILSDGSGSEARQPRQSSGLCGRIVADRLADELLVCLQELECRLPAANGDGATISEW